MSGEPKTLTPQAMTLEEFLAELGNERNASLARYKYPDGTEQWAAMSSWGDPLEWAHTWPELATKVRGVPVVVRDEAAELRAAVLDWWQARTDLDRAYPAWIRGLPEGESYAKYMAAAKEIGAKQQRVWDELREWARRLAGGENER